jgi:predicted  nucleic acid-binding Zn-ribbon protein
MALCTTGTISNAERNAETFSERKKQDDTLNDFGHDVSCRTLERHVEESAPFCGLKIPNLSTDVIKTDKLCLGDKCMTEEQLEQVMLFGQVVFEEAKAQKKKVNEDVQDLQRRMRTVEGDAVGKSDFRELKSRFEATKQEADTKLNDLDLSLQQVRNTVQNDTASPQDLANLRVKVETNTTGISDLRGSFDDQTKSIDLQRDALDEHSKSISNLSGNIDERGDSISKLRTEMGGLDQKQEQGLSSIEGRLDGHDGDISRLRKDVDGNTGDISDLRKTVSSNTNAASKAMDTARSAKSASSTNSTKVAEAMRKAAAAKSAPAKVVTKTVSRPNYNKRNCVVWSSYGQDLPGQPISGNLNFCKKKCTDDNRCKGFSRQRRSSAGSNSACYLKSNVSRNCNRNGTWDTYVK